MVDTTLTEKAGAAETATGKMATEGQADDGSHDGSQDEQDADTAEDPADDHDAVHEPRWSPVCRWWTRKHAVASYVVALWTLLSITALTARRQVTAVAIVYTILFSVLIAVRLVTYCMWKRAEFLMDTCYMINVTVIVYIFAFPDNGTMHNIAFLTSHTMPLYAAIAYGNALDLRTYGQLTSCLIHFGPVFVMTLIRWQEEATSIYGRPYGRCENDDSIWCSPWVGVGIGAAATVVHAIPYMMVTFIHNEKRLQDPEYLNNFIYAARSISQNWGAYRRSSERFKKIMYVVSYTGLPIVLSPMAVVYWKYMWADYAAVGIMFGGMSIQAGNRQHHHPRVEKKHSRNRVGVEQGDARKGAQHTETA